MNWFRLIVVVALSAVLLPELYFRVFYVSSWKSFEGSWALVTGSSYGIGKDVAISLASRGLNIIVHGRSKEKLEEQCALIRRDHHRECKVIVQDVIGDPNWNAMAAEIAGLDISVLVNNVGGGSPDGVLSRFHEFSREYLQKVLDFNLGSALSWTHLVVPGMVKRGGGRVIMCSSLAYMGTYKTSVYGASKCAIHGLVYLLNNEYDSVVRAETWLIGPVSTPALNNAEPDGWFIVSSPDFARRALDLFGFYEEYAPALGHAIQHFALKLMPPSLRSRALAAASASVLDSVQKRASNKEL
jgi:short-subunit dehydrogenase